MKLLGLVQVLFKKTFLLKYNINFVNTLNCKYFLFFKVYFLKFLFWNTKVRFTYLKFTYLKFIFFKFFRFLNFKKSFSSFGFLRSFDKNL